MYKPEDLSTPTKRPTSGSGFIINTSKTLVIPDDQMDIDDEDDDQNEMFDEDLRGMVLPTVVQSSSLKQQINRKSKQQQPIGKESRQHQDDDENNTDHEINSSRKKYPEKVDFHFSFQRTHFYFNAQFRFVHRKVLRMHLKLDHYHLKWKQKFTMLEIQSDPRKNGKFLYNRQNCTSISNDL